MSVGAALNQVCAEEERGPLDMGHHILVQFEFLPCPILHLNSASAAMVGGDTVVRSYHQDGKPTEQVGRGRFCGSGDHGTGPEP